MFLVNQIGERLKIVGEAQGKALADLPPAQTADWFFYFIALRIKGRNVGDIVVVDRRKCEADVEILHELVGQ